MRIAVLAVALATAFVSAAPAFSAESVSPPTASPGEGKDKKKQDDPNRVVCTREHVVGSNRPQKVCMTVAERQRLKDQADRTLDTSRGRPGGKELMGSGGPG